MILPAINSVCAYQFTPEFASLNGVYTLVELISFNQAIADDINFVADLYTPAGLSSAQYLSDAPTYQNQSVLYLVPVNSANATIYAPANILAMVPDPMVGCYNKLAIGLSLGLFEDQTTLNWVLSELNAILAAAVGVTAPAKVYSLGVEYMRVVDYEALVAARTAAMTPYTTLYQQLQAQVALTEAAQTLNEYYEATIIALAASGGA